MDPTALFLGLKHSDETRKKMSDAQKGNTNGFKQGQARPLGAGKPSQQIEVTDIKNNKTTCYDSFANAAKALNIKYLVISNYFRQNQQKPYKKRYIFKKL
jgi:hypothetical protein